MDTIIETLFDRPKVIGIIAETNQGKSNLLYFILSKLQEGKYTHHLYTYGLRCDLGENKIYSLGELERITDSIIVCDEFQSLFDIEDRKNRKAIENSLRLINHNNNILILCGLPDNYKKFLSSKVDTFIFKQCSLASFINGSRAKNICLQYKGAELGSSTLSMRVDEALLFDKHYTKLKIPYMKEYDTKSSNIQIVKRT